MTHRTITAEEARTLREAATPGPWENRTRGNDAELLIQPVVRATVDHWARPKLHCSLGDRLLISAAADLAATVEALHAEVERLRAAYERLEAAAGRASETLCPECGPAVQVDEDGCCVCCGNGAMGTYVTERAEALVAALEAP